MIGFDGKKVVLSGDTKYEERVARAAQGADLLVHEIATIDPKLSAQYRSYKNVENHHTSLEEAKRIFSLSKSKLAVYSHIVSATLPPAQEVLKAEFIRRAQTTFDGPFVIGEDLMPFVIADATRQTRLRLGWKHARGGRPTVTTRETSNDRCR